MTTIPDTTNAPDAGLIRNKGFLYACYTEDGRRKRRKIGAATFGAAKARKLRDEFYEELVVLGARVAERGTPKVDHAARRQRVARDPMKYIRHEPKVTRSPWSVRIGATVHGRFTTAEAAQKARNKIIGLKEATTPPAAGVRLHAT